MAFFSTKCKPNILTPRFKHEASHINAVVNQHHTEKSNCYTILDHKLKSDLLPRLLHLKEKGKDSSDSLEQEKTLSAHPSFSHTTTPKSQQTTNLVDINCGDKLESPLLLITNEKYTQSVIIEHSHQTPTCDRQKSPRGNNKRVITSSLKRFILPFKIYYELEWPSDNSSSIWLQLDEQLSKGIERVRRLGFSNIDIRLDDGLTKYINDYRLIDKRSTTILIEILFISGSNNINNYGGHSRKDSVLQVSSNDKEGEITSNTTNVHLLRLRRVHWWTKNYNLARLYHV